MPELDIKTSDLKRLHKQMQRLPKEMQGKVYEAGLTAAANVALARAKAKAPVKTGALKDSIKLEVTDGWYTTVLSGNKKRIPRSKVVLTSDVQYAFINEWRKPFIRPAVAETASEQLSAFQRAGAVAFDQLINGMRAGK